MNVFVPIFESVNMVQYESADDLPASAPEGTIAIIVVAAITRVFVGPHPPASPLNMDKWVWTGSQSQAPIQFNDEISFYPRAVYQYNNRTHVWVLKPGYVFTSGAWVELSMYVYDNGEEILETVSEYGASADVTFIKQASYIEGQAVYNVNNVYDWLYTDDPIDLTDVSTLYIKSSGSGTYFSGWFGVSGAKNGSAFIAQVALGTSELVRSVDVSSLTGDYYIGVKWGHSANAGSGGERLYVNEMYLER